MIRTKNIGFASVREKKAAALDTLVKSELTKNRAAAAAKMSNLRALRLAKEAQRPVLPVANRPIKSPAHRLRRVRPGS
jgi:hypothetical protein